MPPSQSSNAVLLERIENVRQDVSDLAELLKENIDQQKDFEKSYNKEHAMVETKAAIALSKSATMETTVAQISVQIEALKNTVSPLIMMSRIVGWLAFLLGTSIVALIWGILTHQVTLTFP